MKTTNSKDGIKRASINITQRIDLQDIADALTAKYGERVVDEIVNSTKPELISGVKYQLENYGTIGIEDTISVDGLEEYAKEAVTYLIAKFPEFV